MVGTFIRAVKNFLPARNGGFTTDRVTRLFLLGGLVFLIIIVPLGSSYATLDKNKDPVPFPTNLIPHYMVKNSHTNKDPVPFPPNLIPHFNEKNLIEKSLHTQIRDDTV